MWLFRALDRHEVACVTVGGVAIQAYGGQRMTQDLDVAIAASKGNMQRLAAALVTSTGASSVRTVAGLIEQGESREIMREDHPQVPEEAYAVAVRWTRANPRRTRRAGA